MAEEKRTLVQRLVHWLFGEGKANRADQKERRDDMAAFMGERAEDEEEREDAAEESRGNRMTAGKE